MSLGGKHGHKIRELKRRMDAILEEDRERRRPLPLPVSEEHAAKRERIERGLAALLGGPEDPESTDLRERLDERIAENPDCANDAAQLLVLMREEEEYLAGQGVDPHPWCW